MNFLRYSMAGAVTLTVILAPHSPAAAQDRMWFVHVGPGMIDTAKDAHVEVAGTEIPGAEIRMRNRVTGVVEVGRFLTPQLAVGFTAGFPVKQSVIAAGTIAPYGQLGRITYGPVAATVQWHPLRSEAVQPYIGAGVSYLHVFKNDATALQNLHASDGVGPVLQAGVHVPVQSRWGLFVDAKKAFIRTRATGSLAGAPVDARIEINPLVLHAGITLRF